MKDLWLGAPIDAAQCVFLLPNKPALPTDENRTEYITEDSSLLIELNGNHWRKILTIMAKLLVPEASQWREFRDGELLKTVGIAFSTERLLEFPGLIYIVGNTFREEVPIPNQAFRLGDKQHAYINLPYIWCPYLDYRQFPNALIEQLREHIMER